MGASPSRALAADAGAVCVYLGVAVPVIGIGVISTVFSLFTAIAVFAVVTGSTALLTAGWHLRQPSRT